MGVAVTRKRKQKQTQYSLLDELMASPFSPLPDSWIRHQLTVMNQAMEAICKAPNPSTSDWRSLSDAVNLMETLTTAGPWNDCDGALVEVNDESGLLADAIAALATAGKRNIAGKPIRLDAPGILAVRSILEDYAAILKVLPARTMVRVHRLTEKRISEILTGQRRPHDVEVIDL